MRELHLFAGAGGGILGGILLGHTCVCAVEIEPYCQKVLLQRQRDGILPKFPIWDDVRTFNGKPWKGKVDVVCGGFPCQDISSAGTGEGIDGARSGLWREMARESFAKYNHDTHSWKTPQCSLFEGLEESWVIWSRWGWMQSGESWALTKSEQDIQDNESGYLPTPCKKDADFLRYNIEERGEHQIMLCNLWKTINDTLLNPIFSEIIMFWPTEWTDLQPLEMGKFQQWLNSHGSY